MNITSSKNWKVVKLGDVASIQTGPFGSQLHESDYVENGIPMITVEHLFDDRISHAPDIPKVSSEDAQRLKKYTLEKGDIVFSRVGSVDRLGFVSEAENGWMFSGRLLRVRPSDIEPQFAYYALANPRNKEYIRKIAVGATMPSLNTGLLFNVPLMIPESLDEQREIAGVLGCLDDKIELLRKENKTLESIAQTLFKEWFVDFNYPSATGKMTDSELGQIPEGWRVGKLGEVLEIRGGTTPSTTNSDFWNGDIYWTSPKDLSDRKDIFLTDTEKKITVEGLRQIGSGLLPKGTLLLSSRAPIGYLAIAEVDLAINQGYIAVLPSSKFSNYFAYLWIKEHMQDIVGAANGSTFLEISKSSFKNLDCIVPDDVVLEKFTQTITPQFEKMRNNVLEIQNLSKLRDELLNKIFAP